MTKMVRPAIKNRVEELFARYCRIVDCKRYEKLSEVFTKNVRIHVVLQGQEFSGIKSFVDFLEKTKPFSEDRMHFVANVSVRSEGSKVEALAYWHSTMTFKNFPVIEGGIYEAKCKVSAAVEPMRFESFRIFHKYRTPANVNSWKEVGYPGTVSQLSKDVNIFNQLESWF